MTARGIVKRGEKHYCITLMCPRETVVFAPQSTYRYFSWDTCSAWPKYTAVTVILEGHIMVKCMRECEWIIHISSVYLSIDLSIKLLICKILTASWQQCYALLLTARCSSRWKTQTRIKMHINAHFKINWVWNWITDQILTICSQSHWLWW